VDRDFWFCHRITSSPDTLPSPSQSGFKSHDFENVCQSRRRAAVMSDAISSRTGPALVDKRIAAILAAVIHAPAQARASSDLYISRNRF
jgi:hypothetical protein